MSQIKPELRVVTYMCPTHPVQLYELLLEVLEEALDCHTTLQYESRSSGPFPDRPDPFSTDKVDIGKYFFIGTVRCTRTYATPNFNRVSSSITMHISKEKLKDYKITYFWPVK